MYFSRAVSRSVTAVGRRFGRSLSATAFQPAVSPKIRVAAGVAGMSMAVCSAVRMSLLALLFYILLHFMQQYCHATSNYENVLPGGDTCKRWQLVLHGGPLHGPIIGLHSLIRTSTSTSSPFPFPPPPSKPTNTTTIESLQQPQITLHNCRRCTEGIESADGPLPNFCWGRQESEH